ncbi:Crp/Fnr family transcriptional regulator [Sporocytophaga myxococcoides]|uniref:Crp/Fnr family transcriptional regulator n=1 Tax=Sporocytophaga myxococcoides TaxID=153721 RepID=UPI0003F609F7|nr:Crp/Fnr family transcriptional regulator [Sporocytophaga myxococcoides]
MIEVLLDHISKYTKLNNEATEEIAKSFGTFELHKRRLILSEGELCSRIYFVAKGCLRMFYLDEKGTEQTIQFALENWWMTDIDAFNRKGIATFSIQAVENTTVLGINKDDWDLLLEKHPGLEKYFRIIYERAYAASLTRMKFFRLPKDEFYKFFSLKYPAFIQRIPQKLLASFLGFTPEYLSELRKKK